MINSKHQKRLIFWLMIPIFNLIVIMGVLYAYINSGYFRSNLKSILLTQLENNLGLSIEIGNLDSISFQSLQLTDITVFEDSLSKEDILFQAEKIKARFNLFFSFLHWKNWQLNVHEITFYRASIDITRERNGEFDLLNKLELKVEEDQQKFFIERINFQYSILTFHDKLVNNYNQDALTTQVKYIQGHLDLSQLPEIIFDFQGRQEKGNAFLALQGKTSIDQPKYSLVFHLENADIAHFQYYLEAVEQLNITQGKFNLSLNLEFSPEWEQEEVLWRGEATFQQVSVQPNILEGIYFEDISGSVQFLKSEIKISELKGFYRGSPISLQGVLITEPAVYFDFDIESEDIDTSNLIEDISLFIADYSDFSMQGSINLSGNIKGQLDDFQMEGKISSPEINIENIIFQNIECSFLLNHNTLFISSLNIRDSEASLTLNGKIDWSEDIPFYQFFLETKYLSLKHSLFNQFSFLEDVSSNLVGQLKMESDRQDSSVLNVEGQFVANSLKIKEISLADSLQGKIKSVIHFSDYYITIHAGEFAFKKTHGSLNGKINYSDPINFDLYFEGLVPQIDELIASTSLEVETIPTATGSIEIKGSFTGHPENPEIYVEFYLQEFTFQDYMLDEVNGKLVFHENTIYLEEFALKNPGINLSGNGNIALPESGLPGIDLFYQFDTVAIASLIQTLKAPLPLSGQISGNGNLQGIWPGLVLKGSFQLEQIIYDGYPLGKGQVVFNLKPEQTMVTDNLDNLNDDLPEIFSWLGGHSYSFNLEKFILQNEMINLSIFGQICMGEDNQFAGEIDFSHQNLPDIVEYFYPLDNNNYLKRFLPSRITGKAKLEGDRYEQQLTLSAQFKLPQQEDNLPTKLESIIKRNEQGFKISDLRLIQPGGQLKVEGNISLDQKLDIVFQAEELDLNTLMSLTQTNEVIKGIINIKGSCRGAISQPEVSIIAQIKEGYFREFQFENLQSNLYWGSKTNIMEIREFVIALEQDYRIQAKGSLPLDALVMKREEGITPETPGQDIPLDFQIKMDNTDMKILRLFWEDAFSEISGFIDVELNLTGTSRKPLVNGVIEVNQGKVTLADLPVDVEIEELNTRIEVSNNRVAIPPIRFIIYDHHFNLSGQLELMNFLPDHMLITIRNEEKRIVYQNIIECEADFLAEIKGSLFEPEIKGQLVLSKGNLNLDQLLAMSREGGLEHSTLAVSDTLQGKLDMNIEIADPFSLRLSNAEIFVTGKINLTDFLTQPNIQGNIVLKKGYFIYFENRFEITEGHININGSTVNDIDINARAQTNIRDVRVMVYVYGNLANLQIRLSSEPSMQETEIISLLTLGRNIEGLSKGEIDQLLSQEMINIIFQSLQINILKQLEREIANQLGLDFLRLSIDNLITSDSQFLLLEGINLADLTLEIGKNVGEKFFITYKTPLDFQGEKSISIDYKLSPLFTFNTQLDTYSLKEDNYRLKFGLKINF